MRLSEMVKLLEDILSCLVELKNDRQWGLSSSEGHSEQTKRLIKEVTAAIKEAKDAQTGGEKSDAPSPSSVSVDGPRE